MPPIACLLLSFDVEPALSIDGYVIAKALNLDLGRMHYLWSHTERLKKHGTGRCVDLLNLIERSCEGFLCLCPFLVGDRHDKGLVSLACNIK